MLTERDSSFDALVPPARLAFEKRPLGSLHLDEGLCLQQL